MYKRNYKVSISNYPYCSEHVEVTELEQRLGEPAEKGKKCVVYVHIPFCTHICDFCVYCHEQVTSKEQLEKYTQAVINEIQLYGKKAYVSGLSVEAIFFGGGTPSILTSEQFTRILKTCQETFQCVEGCEISTEVNIQSATEKKIEQFRRAGVDRISAGIQTFDDSTRETLGLSYKQQYLRDWIKMESQYGFPVMALDLMYGNPKQSVEAVRNDVEIAASLGISHISLYQLCLIQATLLFDNMQKYGWQLPDEDVSYQMFQAADEGLRRNGFHNTVVPEYSLSGKESVFWNQNFNPDYERLSFGASAYGYLSGRTYQNASDVGKYIEMVEQGRFPLDTISEELSSLQKLERSLIFQSRKQVIDSKSLEEKYGDLYKQYYEETICKLIEDGLANQDNTDIRLTLPGMYLQEDIATKFMKSLFEGKSRLFKKLVIGKQKLL